MKSLLVFFFFTSFSFVSIASDHIFTRVKLNGHTYNFLVDNGVEYTTIFKNRIKESYEMKRATFVIDPNHDTTTVYITTDKLKLEMVDIGLKFKAKLFVLPIANESLASLGIDGIIGNDILSKYDWKLDFKTKSISLAKKKKLNDINFKTISFRDNLSIDLDLVKNNGTKMSSKVHLDLGFHGFISVLDTSHFSSDSIVRLGRNGTIIGTKYDTSYIEAVDMIFEELKISNFPVNFKKSRQLNLLGLRFLSIFDEVYLIYSDNKIYLPNVEGKVVKINKIGIFNDVIESLIIVKGEPEKKWTLGEKLEIEYDLRDEDYIYYNIKLEDIKQN